MSAMSMEIGIGIAVGVFCVLLVIAAVAIGCVVRRKLCKNSDDNEQQKDSTTVPSTAGLVDEDGIEENNEGFGEDITIKEVIDDELWIDEMTEVMQHCQPVLQGCHTITMKTIHTTVEYCQNDEHKHTLERVAKEVTPKMDSIVQLLNKPVDPVMIESRCITLIEAVEGLVSVCKKLCPEDEDFSWLIPMMQEIHEHMQVIRQHTTNLKLSTSPVETTPSHFTLTVYNEDNSSDGRCSNASSSNADSGIADTCIDVHVSADVENT